MPTAQELLKKLKEGARFGNVELKDVEKILAEDVFSSGEGLLCTTDSGSTLLHLAAQTKDESVLPLVLQAYKRSKLFSRAMLMENKNGKNPIHIAIKACQFANAVLLFKECQDSCPKALEPSENGFTLMHSASESAENLNIVKFLLAQEICKPMLLKQWKSPRGSKLLLPMDVAKNLMVQCEFYVKSSEQYAANAAKGKSASYRESLTTSLVDPKKKQLEKVKELFSHIQQLTMEMKAEVAKKQAKELETQKVLERKDKVDIELDKLLQTDSNWNTVLDYYLLPEDEETQKITVSYLSKRCGNTETPLTLPPLSEPVLKVIVHFLNQPEDDPILLAALKLLELFVKTSDSKKTVLQHKEPSLTSRLSHLLSSLNTEIQSLCCAIFLNLVTKKADETMALELPEDSDEVQALLLVKHFSLSDNAKSLASEVMAGLNVGNKQPDPGSWSVRRVSFWMESITVLEKRSEYRKSFSDAGIDGLHLLELSSVEMMGLGMKYVSDQRKLSNAIDELRRMNMRAVVGQKDVFLSYAHININFARRIKRVLNDADYTVWIDEAGIRAGHKWRNEIADGIQGCRVVVYLMTPRSTNSEYCQDEIALAEEYHKPIMTIRLEQVTEMDPGLKLIIQRRQWIDFIEESTFHSSSQELVEALRSSVGPGSGSSETAEEVVERAEAIAHTPDKAKTVNLALAEQKTDESDEKREENFKAEADADKANLAPAEQKPDDETSEEDIKAEADASPTHSSNNVVELLRAEFQKMREELRKEVEGINSRLHKLETSVDGLARKVDSLKR